MIFKTISSLFLIVAIVCILDLRPQQIADDILKLTVKKQTIREQARALRTGKKKKSFGQRLLYGRCENEPTERRDFRYE